MSSFNLQKNKKDKPKTSAIPRGLREASNELHRTRITKKHYKGREQIPQLGLVDKWEARGIEYFINTSDINKTKFTHPRVYTEQKKNIYLLVNYVYKQKEQNNGQAKATFTLGEYLRDKGYTDKEIKRGGKCYELASQVIESGANTRYGRVIKSADGKTGRQVIGNFYNLLKEGRVNERSEIKGKGTKYTIVFSHPYSSYIENIMKKEGQFYPVPMKLIQDRYVDKNPTLFNFIDYLVYTRGGKSFPIRIENLLKEIGVLDRYIKEEPKKCFDYLKECLAYAYKEYPDLIKRVRIYNSDKSKWLPIEGLSLLQFKEYELTDFVTILSSLINEKDFRKCCIAFSQKSNQTLNQLINRAPNGLKQQIMRWVEAGIDFDKTKITKEGTDQFISSAIKRLGADQVEQSFNHYLNSNAPDPFRFVTKSLPELIKGVKREGELRPMEDLLKSRF